MSRKKDQSITKVFIFVFIVFVFYVGVFPIVKANDSDGGFDPPDGEKSNSGIRRYVIEGAAYFLNAYSQITLFLNKIELSEIQGTDYNELQEIINRAAADMNAAKETYTTLKQIADITPYNQDVIAALADFDYQDFMEKNNLDGYVFEKVKNYLKKGDIRGIYDQSLLDTVEILNYLTTINTAVDAGKFPVLSDLWNLNQICSQSLLLGQYTSMIFHEILNKK
jgi:hypothetical protein